MKSAFHIFVFTTAIVFTSCQSKKETDAHNHESTASSTTAPADTLKKSIPKEEHLQIGSAHVMIKYHAPAVRGRTIWGGLVPYGDVWVAGAHSATTFEIDKDFIAGEKAIPAGKYALFTIPQRDKWTIIINTNWDQHLADEYDQKEDLLRLDVTPEQLQNTQERLKYSIVSKGASDGSIEFSWEKIKVALPFTIK